ncbi:MAG: ISNCY family transposase, partial [Bacteroidota bacterium]
MILRIEHNQLTVAEAAESLDLSERHLYRILQRYRAEGEAGLCHRLRGRRSNKAFAQELRTKTLRLYREQYSDYGPTLFAEKLAEHHDVCISRQTATRWLSQAALWSGNRKKRPHRKKRERRDALGSLIQFDGSPHDWFEGRGPECCLLVAIDDASSRTMLRFVPVEDTHHVLALWLDYIERYGIPAEAYTDWGSVYVNTDHPERLTPFGHALKALGIRHIKAGSPQAKGRVERSNRTHQDRLIKALREHNISTIEQANHFLETDYMNAHNQRFAHPNGLTDIHRSAAGIDLANIFSIQQIRHVYNDWTITLHTQFIQLLKSDAPLPPPRSKVIVR